MTETYKIEFVRRCPVVEKDGARWLVDTGCPRSWPNFRLPPATEAFLGVPGIRMLGADLMGPYVKIDYAAGIFAVSDRPIPLEGTEVPYRVGDGGRMLVEMSVDGNRGWYWVDTGAAYSYVHGLGHGHDPAGVVQENDLFGHLWEVPVFDVPCSFAGCDFTIQCGDAADNRAPVPPEGVIGHDFFKAFAVVFDRRNGRLVFRPSRPAA